MLKGNENPETHDTDSMCDYCTWISKILARIGVEAQIKKKKKKGINPVIIVHGGAGRIPRYAQKFMLDEVKLFTIHITHFKQHKILGKQLCAQPQKSL